MGRSRQRRGCARERVTPFRTARGTDGARGAILACVFALGLIPPAAHAANAPLPQGGTAASAQHPAANGKTDLLTTQAKADALSAQNGPGAPDVTPASTTGPPPDPALADGAATPYFLEVFINGQPTRLIGEFVRLPDGSFASRAKELRELGVNPPAEARPEDLISLKDIGATARYDEAAQRIDITLDDSKRVRKVFDMHQGAELQEADASGTGMVLNYSLLASAKANKAFASSSFEGASANLEGWIYSPLGTVAASGFVRSDGFRRATFVRLESSWRYTDIKRAISYQIGDMITSGPNWARPVRMGGVRVSRNFNLRPDLVTVPLPSLSGTAAVPTTVDVYLNNIKVHSQEVDAGPFTITNIPAISSSGVARLVMRDAAGRETVTERSFYTSPKLLRGNFLEFSVEAGAPRLDYGVKSFHYSHSPGGAASIRYGVSDKLTVHAHAELAKNLQLFGGGATSVLLDKVLVSAAGAVSHSARGTGFLSYGAFETRFGNFSINASSQRVFGDYADLAAISAPASPAGSGVSTADDFPRALDSVSIGYALPDLGGGVSLNFLHAKSRSQGTTNTLSLTYNQRLWRGISFYATAFADLKHPEKPSIFAGITIPLGGGNGTASAGASYDEAGKYRATASYSRPLKQKNGSVGWRARVTYGDLKSAEGSLAWRTSKATVRGSVMQIDRNTLGRVSADGAVVIAGGGVFASNRIHDSFAVVKAGAPGVLVRYENRPVGKTDGSGRILIPTLRSFERNKISIDPETLPVDATIPRDKAFVVPRDRAGVTVDFGIKAHSQAALVTFVDEGGKPLAVGSEVKLQGAEETFVVGYDGEAYLEGLKSANTVIVSDGEKSCKAAFDFAPKPGEQVSIGPVKCTPIAAQAQEDPARPADAREMPDEAKVPGEG